MKVEKTLTKSLRLLLTTGLLLAAATVSASSTPFLEAMEQEFEARSLPRVGLEVEYAGVSLESSATLLHAKVGGEMEFYTDLDRYKEPSTGEIKTVEMPFYKLRKSKAGKIVLKKEPNGTSADGLADRYESSSVLEIVTSPLERFDQVEALQSGLDALVASGAKGTAAGLAVSFQVNVEIAKGVKENITPQLILSILRNYHRKAHREMMEKEFAVPAFRQKYIGLYSPGMMARLEDASYRPTLKQLYDDLMYRQTLEVLGDTQAWSRPLEEVVAAIKKDVEARHIEIVLPVMKWNYVRVSSLMMFLFPEEWMSKALEKSGWIKPNPLLEFREPNNGFDAIRTVKQIVGLVQKSEREGEFKIENRVRRKGGTCRAAVGGI